MRDLRVAIALGCHRCSQDSIAAGARRSHAGGCKDGQAIIRRSEEGSTTMEQTTHPVATGELARRRRELAPDTYEAFQAFSKQVFADGALDAKTKQLIAVAVAHVTQCPYCIQGHTKAALRKGVTEAELMEAIWVAAEMRAGAAYAHSTIALDTAAQGHRPQAA
jgi:AhpD family alkylhydroperoxidase